MTKGHLTRAWIHLDRLTRNLQLLAEEAGGRPLWPVLKANAYGHGAELVAAHLVEQGHTTLCVAHVGEAITLRQAGIDARCVLLSPSLPEHSEAVVEHGFEPVVTTLEAAESLAREARRRGRTLEVHVKVDTGMGRVGVPADGAGAFVARCRALEGLRVRGVMSHFPRADEEDKSFSLRQIEAFRGVLATLEGRDAVVAHMANSAAVLDLPAARFDACRPGIALYGLVPSREIANPRARELAPVLEWKTRITFLKEVPAGTGLSYGHSYTTDCPTLVATLPVGYGDGLSRRLSDRLEVLVAGRRCPQRGRITMDQTLLDVTELRGQVGLGDEAVLIGRQGDAEIDAQELADRLGTIHYEVVTAIASRVARVPVREDS